MIQEGYKAPALEKGLDILEHLAKSDDGQSMMDIAKALRRSHNEIYRMLLVLERKGYLRRNQADRFTLSGKLFDVAMSQPQRRNLHDAALPVMHRLAERTWQSCHLAVISQHDIVVVARVESPDLLGFAVRVGYRRPILQSTSGRILFANLPNAKRDVLWEELSRSQKDDFDQKSYLDDCNAIRENGVFLGPSASVYSVTDISAPIFDGSEEGAIAALTVPFVSGAAAHTSAQEASVQIQRSAQAISDMMRTVAAR